MNIKKIIAVTVLGCLSIAGAAYGSGSGKASTVSINYYQTYSTGSTVPMYEGPVVVSGYVNTASTNTVWYELHDTAGGVAEDKEAAIGFNGTLYVVPSVSTADYHLDLNPDGTNYNSVIANGKAQN